MILINHPPSNQPSKFGTRNWFEIIDESRGAYNYDDDGNNDDSNNNIKFKISMIRSSLCNYNDVYILVQGTIIVPNTAHDAVVNNTNKKVIFKNCAPFSRRITEINNTQVDNGEDIDIVMAMHNLLEYSDAYSKTSKSL